LLGYGVAAKPVAGQTVCVVVRSAEGAEKQAVVVDEEHLQAAIAAANGVKDPGDVVKLEAPEEVLRSRSCGGQLLPRIDVRATRDWKGLDAILRDPEVYEGQRADGCPAIEEATVRLA
jgi:hypothetical protein